MNEVTRTSENGGEPAEKITRILLRHSTGAGPNAALGPDTPLIDGGLDLTSIALLEALVEIEDRLQVRLLDEELSLAVLSSLGRFVEHVCGRLRE